MALLLHLHPLVSFCRKVLIAPHENGAAAIPARVLAPFRDRL